MATCNVQELMDEAACWLCLNKQESWAILLQMFCNIIGDIEAAGSTECADLFSDDFEDGVNNQPLKDPPWRNAGDTFLYFNGWAIEDPGGDGSVAWVGAFSAADAWAEAECWGTDWHGVMLRFDPNVAQHWYAAWIDEDTDVIRLQRGSTTLASTSATFVAGQVLRLEAEGNLFTVKYNGATVLAVRDTTASYISAAGSAGIRGSEDLGAVFDNFRCCSND